MPKRSLLPFSPSSGIIAATFGVLLFAQVQSVSAAALNAPLEEGMRQFQARRYSMALGPLERAVSKSPNDATSRYYLANCYVHLNRHEDAQREYDAAYRLDPFGPVSGYCRRALLGYGMAVPNDAELFAARRPVARKVAMQPSDTISHNAPQHLNRAVDTIRRQADFEKSRHKQSADVFGSNVIKSGEGAAKKILDDAIAECKAIMDAPVNLVSMTGTGGMFVTNAVLEQARATEMERRREICADIRKKADADAARIRAEAQERSQKFKQYSQDRQAALDEVADSLESQLSTSRLKDRVKMRAEGTGLYVRNFGVVPSPSPEVHNSVARIRPHQYPQAPDVPAAETGEPGGPPAGQSAGENGKLPTDTGVPAKQEPEHSVSGKVLDKK